MSGFKSILVIFLLCLKGFALFGQTEHIPTVSSIPAGIILSKERISQLKDKLVIMKSGSLESYDASQLDNKKYHVFYYSAHWCPPCKSFTPKLVDFYRKMKKTHPDFEVIFFSYDKDASKMQSYMKSFKMPWPAIEYSERFNISFLRDYIVPGIPCLIVWDQEGKIVFDCFDRRYPEPKALNIEIVLANFEKKLTEKTP